MIVREGDLQRDFFFSCALGGATTLETVEKGRLLGVVEKDHHPSPRNATAPVFADAAEESLLSVGGSFFTDLHQVRAPFSKEEKKANARVIARRLTAGKVRRAVVPLVFD